MKNMVLPGVLAALFAVDLILITREDLHAFRFLTKTLLVPLLATSYLSKTKKPDIDPFFLAGLIFSFLGDTFLLFKWGFFPGLGSFLLAHLLYIQSFVKLRSAELFITVPFILIYLVCLIFFLHPYLHEMEIPVLIYGITISTMAYFSLCTRNKRLISGALLFVISDSVLAYNLFVNYSAIMEQIVMASYVLAQFFLVRGMIVQKRTQVG